MSEDIKQNPEKDDAEQVDSVLELQQLEKEDPEVEAHGCVSGMSISAH